MDLRTPLNRVRGLGSAKDGTGHFWRQRLTAIANVPLMIFFVWLVLSLNGASFSEVTSMLASPMIAILMLLVLLSGFIHMHLGMQTIIEDYVHGEGKKIMLLVANSFFTILMGAITVYSVLKLGFGG